jgi:tetratricopeptide (TPR) repeat protein
MHKHADNPEAERWKILKVHFEHAVELPAAEREAFIAEACPDDSAMRAQLAQMLDVYDHSNLLIDNSPVQGIAQNYGVTEALSIGETIAGRFRIERRLGAGGMGEVYEASDTALGGSRLALKTIRAEYAAHDAYIARFKQELQLLRQVTHANVCRVFDFVPGSPSFFTMELIEGQTLAARLQTGGPIPPNEAASICSQILEGLQAAHDAGVIHRDLKPANIMLTAGDDPRVVLMDFGVAHGAHAASTGNTALTQGAVVGTPAYMSPEQLQGLPVTPATDIYSFGVVAYEALTGKPPFTGPSPLAIVARKLTTAPTTVVGTGVGIPAAWRVLLERCLAHDPADRYKSAAELLEALNRRGGIEWRWPRRRMHWQWPTAAVASIALAFFAWKWREARPAPEAERFYQQGVAALADASTTRARALFETAVNRSPNYVLAHARLAQAHAALDNPDLARESLLRAMELRSSTILFSSFNRHTFDAIRAIVTRDFAPAVERFQSAANAASASERVPALLDLGIAQELNDQPVPAAQTMQSVLAIEPQNPTAHLRMAMLATRKQDLDGALKALDQARKGYELIGASESIAETWIRRGEAYARVSRFSEARTAMETGRKYAESNRLATQQVRALFGLSSIALGEGEMDEARKLAEEALALARAEKQESQIVFALNDLANAHLTQFKLKETESLARQALELAERYRQPSSAAAARTLLMNTIYYSGGRAAAEEAKRLGEQALTFYQQAGYKRQALKVYLMLGRLENRVGHFAAAKNVFDLAVSTAKATGDAEAEGNAEQGISNALAGMGDVTQALHHARLATSAYRKSANAGSVGYALMAQGELLLELGLRKEGESMMTEAASLSVKNQRLIASIAAARGFYALRRGDRTEAEKWVRVAQQSDDESKAWRAQLDALRAGAIAGSNLSRAELLCRSSQKLVTDGPAFGTRVRVLLSCAETLGARGAFLKPEVDKLLDFAASVGNHSVAWRVSRLAHESEASGRHEEALRAAWGTDIANRYLAVWSYKENKK